MVSEVARRIYESLGSELNLDENRALVADRLPELLKAFSIRLRRSAKSDTEIKAAVFMRQHREYVYRNLNRDDQVNVGRI